MIMIIMIIMIIIIWLFRSFILRAKARLVLVLVSNSFQSPSKLSHPYHIWKAAGISHFSNRAQNKVRNSGGGQHDL